MKIPGLTAEYSPGPALQTYAYTGPGRAGAAGVTSMGILDTITGTLSNVFSGIAAKIPCLLECGLPNALAIAPQCGMNPACWLALGGPAALACFQQCT